jgi:hypothetical protein
MLRPDEAPTKRRRSRGRGRKRREENAPPQDAGDAPDDGVTN